MAIIPRDIYLAVKKMIDPLVVRMRLMIGRAVLTAITDSRGMQVVAADYGQDDHDGSMDRMQDYGMTSAPPKGSHLLVLCPSGRRTMAFAIKADHPSYRPTGLTEGEVQFYTKWWQEAVGHHIKFKADKTILVGAEALNVGLVAANRKAVARDGDEVTLGTVIPPAPLPTGPLEFWAWVTVVHTILLGILGPAGPATIGTLPPTGAAGTVAASATRLDTE